MGSVLIDDAFSKSCSPRTPSSGAWVQDLRQDLNLNKKKYFGQSYELLMGESMAQTFSKSVNLPPEAHTWLSWLPGAEPRADCWQRAPAVSRHTGKVGTDDGPQYVKEMLVKTNWGKLLTCDLELLSCTLSLLGSGLVDCMQCHEVVGIKNEQLPVNLRKSENSKSRFRSFPFW